MAKTESFKKATENAKTAGFKGAVEKLKPVNFAAEFKKRDVILGNSELEK